jgi:hypothetical protein
MPRYCTCQQKRPATGRLFADSHGPEWPMRITARPQRLLAVPCRVKGRGGTREREAESPGNRWLPGTSFVLLVGLRNRSKFRFALSSCVCASPCQRVTSYWRSLTLHLPRGVAHLEYTSRLTLISVSQNCKHFFANNSLPHARDHIDRKKEALLASLVCPVTRMESAARIIRTSSRRS